MISRYRTALAALLLTLGLAATTPAAALAAHHKNSHASKKKHKKKSRFKHGKKRKKTNVLARCATVTIVCSATPGPPGANGANGADGANGLPGSATLAAAATNTGPFTSSSTAPADIPLSGNFWTQQPSEVDFITGEATFQGPAACTPPTDPATGAPAAALYMTIFLDGGSLGVSTAVPVNLVDTYSGTATKLGKFIFNSFGAGMSNGQVTNVYVIPAPGRPTVHSLRVAAVDACGDMGHYSVTSVQVDVAALR